MADRDDENHISKLTDEQLKNLYDALLGLRANNEKMAKSLNRVVNKSVEGPFGVQLHIGGDGKWEPDIKSVDGALKQVADELAEREFLNEED